MRLTTRARYAVMAMVDLAFMQDGRPVKLAEIAERQDISLSYLEQLFAKLRRGDLVRSTRGPGGGYRLARPVEQVSIADIVLAVEEPISATRCVSGSGRGCRKDAGKCQTHDLWAGLGNQIHLYLSAVTLHDVVSGRVSEIAALPIETKPMQLPPSVAAE
jgi:Rrf2 family iron-sulfur cluster assembly transcriptional regulator